MREVIQTDSAPRAVGPYSQAIAVAGCVWVSGQIALDPHSGELLADDIQAETIQVMKNLSAVLEAAGSGLASIIKATVYLTDLGDFERVNEVYGSFFTEAPPARVCIEVSRLPKGASVEIDAVAEIS
jgi:2-iminobutanoate/2-iminopropanoate deaminase